MDDTAVRAGIRFAVMAVVLMPLLPAGPHGPARRRQAARAVGVRAVLLGHQLRRLHRAPLRRRPPRLPGGRPARRHRLVDERDAVVLAREPARRRGGRPAPRVRRARRLHHAVRARRSRPRPCCRFPLARQLVPLLAAPFLVGVAAVLIGLRRPQQERPEVQTLQNPLQLGAALQMAVLFQAVLFMVEGVRATWGDVGLVVSGAILGLADVDALMISMAHTAADRAARWRAPATAVAVGHPVEHAVQAGPGDVALPPAVQAHGGAGPGARWPPRRWRRLLVFRPMP
ncbi:MAG: DUF4010 domain-containing protein [Candidatus Moduliflexus flocculans]|nr:DUF4010 domain-containing protein [Candidatus Moduliflexus flocculans]